MTVLSEDRISIVPQKVGRYELLVPIASGGMATVYLARKQSGHGFDRLVALKQTHAHLREQPEWIAELIEEAKLASRIVHPNVVQVLDVDDDAMGVFLVMQYVEGDTLSGLMRHALKQGTRVPIGVAIRVLTDAFAGLHAAHELRNEHGEQVSVVHRDFSPQNVLVGIDGVARLTDFGIAKAADRVGSTRTGTIKGKFGYMSPEQVRDEPLDPRSDVFSAGVVAWELLGGRRLHPSGDQTSTLLKIATTVAPRLSTAVAFISPEIEQAVASALTLKRQERYASAEQFRQALLTAFSREGELPSLAEVGAYVRTVAGPKLAERRKLCDEVVALRSRMSHAAEAEAAASSASVPERELVGSGTANVLSEELLTQGSVATDAQSPSRATRTRLVGVIGSIGLLAGLALGVRIWSVTNQKEPRATEIASTSPAQLSPAVSSAPPAASPSISVVSSSPSDPPAVATASAIVVARRPASRSPALRSSALPPTASAPQTGLLLDLKEFDSGKP